MAESGTEYVTQVSKFVDQGASRDFRRSYENWLNSEQKARMPGFNKNCNGTRSFPKLKLRCDVYSRGD